MRKAIIFLLIIIVVISIKSIFLLYNETIDTTNSQLVELKEKNLKQLEKYKTKYGNATYGLVAFILDKIRIYSIPFSILAFTIVGLHYIIRNKKFGNNIESATFKGDIHNYFNNMSSATISICISN